MLGAFGLPGVFLGRLANDDDARGDGTRGTPMVVLTVSPATGGQEVNCFSSAFNFQVGTWGSVDAQSGRAEDGTIRRRNVSSGICELQDVTPTRLASSIAQTPSIRPMWFETIKVVSGVWDCVQFLPRTLRVDMESFGEGGRRNKEGPFLVHLRLPQPTLDALTEVAGATVTICALEGLDGTKGCGALEGLRHLHQFTVWASVLVGTSALAIGPLVAFVHVLLPRSADVVSKDLLDVFSASQTDCNSQDGSSGAVYFSLQQLHSQPSSRSLCTTRFDLKVGPLEALLLESFGPVCGVEAGPLELAVQMELGGLGAESRGRRRSMPMPVVPPIWVACRGGVHCILPHQVIASALDGLVALAVAPWFGCARDVQVDAAWEGVACLTLLESGEICAFALHVTANGQASALTRRYDLRPLWQVVSVPAVAVAIPPISRCMPQLVLESTIAAGGAPERDTLLLVVWPTTAAYFQVLAWKVDLKALMGASMGKGACVENATLLEDTSKHFQQSVLRRVASCCSVGSSEQGYDMLCVAIQEEQSDPTAIGRPQICRLAALELWHPGVAKIGLDQRGSTAENSNNTVCDFEWIRRPRLVDGVVATNSGWPDDAELDILVAGPAPDGKGDIVFVTCALLGLSRAYVLPTVPVVDTSQVSSSELKSWGFITDQATKHAQIVLLEPLEAGDIGQLHPSVLLLQVTDYAVSVYRVTSVTKPLTLLLQRQFEPSCCLASSVLISGSEAWIFVAAGAVLTRSALRQLVGPAPRASEALGRSECRLSDGPQRLLTDHAAALCVVVNGVYPDSVVFSAPHIVVALWHDVRVVILDGSTLVEICSVSFSQSLSRTPGGALGRTCAMLALPPASMAKEVPSSEQAKTCSLLLVTVSGALLKIRLLIKPLQDGTPALHCDIQHQWRLGRGRWRLVSDGYGIVEGASGPPFESQPWAVVVNGTSIGKVGRSGVRAFLWLETHGLIPCNMRGAAAVAALSPLRGGLGSSGKTNFTMHIVAFHGGCDTSCCLGLSGPEHAVLHVISGGPVPCGRLELRDSQVLGLIAFGHSSIRQGVIAVALLAKQRSAAKHAGRGPMLTPGQALQLKLILIGMKFDVVGTICLESIAPCADTGMSASLQELPEGVLVALAHVSAAQGLTCDPSAILASPPSELFRIRFDPLLYAEGRSAAWDNVGNVCDAFVAAGGVRSRRSGIAGSVAAKSTIRGSCIVTSHEWHRGSPVVLGKGGVAPILACLDATTFRPVGETKLSEGGFSGRGAPSALCILALGQPHAHRPALTPLYLFCGFTAGAVAIFRLVMARHDRSGSKTDDAESVEFEVLRLVQTPGADQLPRPPITRVISVVREAGGRADTSCDGVFGAFLALDAFGHFFAWRFACDTHFLDEDNSHLSAEVAPVYSVCAEGGADEMFGSRCFLWAVGRFDPWYWEGSSADQLELHTSISIVSDRWFCCRSYGRGFCFNCNPVCLQQGEQLGGVYRVPQPWITK